MPPGVAIGPPVPAPVEATIDGVAAAIESLVNAIPPVIQPIPDAIAAPVEAIRQSWMAAIPGTVRPSVQVPVDAGPLAIQAAVDVIATPIQAILDAMSVPFRVGRRVMECSFGFGQGFVSSRARGAQQAEAGQGCRVEDRVMPMHGVLLSPSIPCADGWGLRVQPRGVRRVAKKLPEAPGSHWLAAHRQADGKPGREGRLR